MSLRIRKLSEEPGSDEVEEGYSGVNSVWVVLKRTDLADFSSRIFRMEPGGRTRMHTHDREHVAVVIRGTCRVDTGTEFKEVREGSIVTVPANTSHRFSNASPEGLVLLIMNFYTAKSAPEAEAAAGGEP